MKKKTYVLMISQRFPQTHKRKGEQTNFVLSIAKWQKIHTIRANYYLWEKRIEEINRGEATLSVRVWEGKPYRSKQREVHEFVIAGIEKLTFSLGQFNQPLINGKYCLSLKSDIAKNDGLSPEDFEEWFKGYDLTKPMAIIHFTNFRYL